jgi:hypothetical protein
MTDSEVHSLDLCDPTNELPFDRSGREVEERLGRTCVAKTRTESSVADVAEEDKHLIEREAVAERGWLRLRRRLPKDREDDDET